MFHGRLPDSRSASVTDESITNDGFTCGLTQNILSILSKTIHFFRLPVPLLLNLSFSCVYISGLIFSFYISDLVPCNL